MILLQSFMHENVKMHIQKKNQIINKYSNARLRANKLNPIHLNKKPLYNNYLMLITVIAN